jgi:hypothetical protein
LASLFAFIPGTFNNSFVTSCFAIIESLFYFILSVLSQMFFFE